MICLGFESVTAGWKVQTNPLSYGVPHFKTPFSRTQIKLQKIIPLFCFIFELVGRKTLSMAQPVDCSYFEVADVVSFSNLGGFLYIITQNPNLPSSLACKKQSICFFRLLGRLTQKCFQFLRFHLKNLLFSQDTNNPPPVSYAKFY